MNLTAITGRGSWVMLSCAVLLAGCSGAPSRAPVESSAILNPERGSRGNPPSYEVFGQRYFVMNSSEGYREHGVASWYGSDFHGRPTSSGEIYDMNLLTAAHKTLPLPTWVEVTNISNGRRVIVKVNDRGPFVGDRIIDLSQRAARDLGMIEAGTARVQVRALGVPVAGPSSAVPPAQPATAARPSSRPGFSIISEARADSVSPDDELYRPWYAQVGAFADRDNAERLARRLRDGGFGNSFVLPSSQSRDRYHRVRIGPIEPRDFDRLDADLSAAGIPGARLVQDN